MQIQTLNLLPCIYIYVQLANEVAYTAFYSDRKIRVPKPSNILTLAVKNLWKISMSYM